MPENFEVNQNKNLSKLNLWKKIWEFAKKLDKILIRDWGTVEKVQQKLEKGINFENYSLKFWKKIKGILGKTSRKF